MRSLLALVLLASSFAFAHENGSVLRPVRWTGKVSSGIRGFDLQNFSARYASLKEEMRQGLKDGAQGPLIITELDTAAHQPVFEGTIRGITFSDSSNSKAFKEVVGWMMAMHTPSTGTIYFAANNPLPVESVLTDGRDLILSPEAALRVARAIEARGFVLAEIQDIEVQLRPVTEKDYPIEPFGLPAAAARTFLQHLPMCEQRLVTQQQ